MTTASHDTTAIDGPLPAMHLQISFDAATVLHETTLKWDCPEVWSRYLEKRVVRVGVRLGARVYTPLGRTDLMLIREYLSRWLREQEAISDDSMPFAERNLLNTVRSAVYRLGQAIDQPESSARLRLTATGG